MSDFRLYLHTLAMLIPVFTAGTCMTLTAFSRHDCLTLQERKLKNIVILYLSMTFLAWFTIFCYVFFPELFVFLNIPCLAGFILAPVFFYRVIRFLTRLEQAERFSPWHYFVPALLGMAFLVWSLFVPFAAQVEIVRSRQLSVAGEYEAYSRFFTTKPLLRMGFMLAYYGSIVQLLVRYYRKANTQEYTSRQPTWWIVFVVALSLAFAGSSVTVTFLPRNGVVSSVYTALAAFGISGQYIVLTFHIIRRRYLPYAVYDEEEKEGDGYALAEKSEEKEEKGNGNRLHTGKLTRRSLRAYFREQKPYLNGGFKITDAAKALEVNRSVMSAFINRNYGVNFNRFVNQWRLKELERLRSLPSNKGKSIAQLFAQAGFTDERQYYRAVAAEREEDMRQPEQIKSKRDKINKIE